MYYYHASTAVKARVDEHKKHGDTATCTTTIPYLETLASVLGPQEVLFLSQDDKSRFPFSIMAANAQSSIHMDLKSNAAQSR